MGLSVIMERLMVPNAIEQTVVPCASRRLYPAYVACVRLRGVFHKALRTPCDGFERLWLYFLEVLIL